MGLRKADVKVITVIEITGSMKDGLGAQRGENDKGERGF